MGDRSFKLGLVVLTTCFICGFFAISYKLCVEHLKIPDQKVEEKRSYQRIIPALRGNIFDCKGRYMAMSFYDREYFVDPHQNEVKLEHRTNIVALVSNVAKIFDLDQEDVWKKYISLSRSEYDELLLNRDADSCWHQYRASNRNNLLLRSNCTNILAAVTNRTLISGIAFKDVIVRDYPEGRKMSHVLGYVGQIKENKSPDFTGCSGIELKFNKRLTGSSGIIEGQTDARRRRLPGRESFLAKVIPGQDVHLTLDCHVQHIAEKILRETVDKFQAAGGWVVVERVKTGEILAMASYPDFDPKHYNNVPSEFFGNNAIRINYEPGSVMKPLMVCAALHSRVIPENYVIDVGLSKVWFFAGRPLRDHATGLLNLKKALVKSSNIYFGKLGLMLGNKRMYQYLKAFNFASTLEINLPGEEAGQVDNYKKWSNLRTTRVPIGQGVSVTALQLANAFACIANDGELMKPHVVRKVTTHKNELVINNQPEVIGRPISKEVARKVREMMIGITEQGGTGTRGAVKGYTVAGKTGTAQKIVNKVYSQTDYYATFVGMIPAMEPEVVILVTIDEPKPQHTGGYVAAPAFSKIAAETMKYLLVPPDNYQIEEDEE